MYTEKKKYWTARPQAEVFKMDTAQYQRGMMAAAKAVHCENFDCTQYSFWLCYFFHCNLAVHVTAQNSN